MQEIEDFFMDRNSDDLLILYFSCHGIKDMNGKLYFASVDTRPKRPLSSLISADFVNEVMKNTNSRRQVLLGLLL